MLRPFIVPVLMGVMLSGCATEPPVKMTWIRIDGSRPDPAQYEVDATICQGAMAQAAVGQTPVYYSGLAGAIAAGAIVAERNQGIEAIGKGCMAQRGYLRVTEEEAMRRATPAPVAAPTLKPRTIKPLPKASGAPRVMLPSTPL